MKKVCSSTVYLRQTIVPKIALEQASRRQGLQTKSEWSSAGHFHSMPDSIGSNLIIVANEGDADDIYKDRAINISRRHIQMVRLSNSVCG